MVDDIGGLGSSGRFGGGVQLIAAAAGVLLLVVMASRPMLSSSEATATFLAGLVVIPLLAFNGVRSIRQGRAMAAATEKTMSGEALREVVRTRELGFHVCTRCNTIGDRDWGNGCARCGSVADFLPVTDEDERKIATSAVVLG